MTYLGCQIKNDRPCEYLFFKKVEKIDLVPGEGLEPSRPYGHMALNHACLPISAPGRVRSFDGGANVATLIGMDKLHLIFLREIDYSL